MWLSGVFSNRQRADAAYKWRNALLALGRRIVEIEARAREFAVRKGKGEEVAAGEADAEAVVTLDGQDQLAEDDEKAAA